MFRMIFALCLIALPYTSVAANYPCSGKKGGVSQCDGPLFVCNDGSISGSKRNCSAELNGGSSKALKATGNTASECPCGGGTLCTGPKGGQYCMTSGGNKSYKRR